jgi:hypothetical protein
MNIINASKMPNLESEPKKISSLLKREYSLMYVLKDLS